VAYLPLAIGIVIAATLASQLVVRVGPRPLMLVGSAMAAGGMFWFSRLTEHASYVGELLGPMVLTAIGLGLLFVPLSLTALHNVEDQHAGVASSLLNTGQQVGGAIGLAALGTVAWTAVADNLRNPRAAIASGVPPAQLVPHALAAGFARGFLVAAGIALLAFVIAVATIRLRRQDLAGAQPAPPPAKAEAEAEAGEQPVLRRHEDQLALAAAARPCRHC
jgi:MFS family permease